MNDSTEKNEEKIHSALAAIVITDVVNYSGLMSTNENLTFRLVQRDLDFLTKQCRRFGGRVLKSTGDGLLMTFDSAADAVSCALSIQRGLAKAALKFKPEHRLMHRIGIHLGDVYLSSNDAMGDGVNVAARLQEQAEPGGICISQTVYDVVKHRLGIKAVFLGPKELKNIREAVPIYRLLLEATGADLGEKHGRIKIPGGRIGLVAAGACVAVLLVTVIALAFSGGDEEKPQPDNGLGPITVEPEHGEDPHRPEEHDVFHQPGERQEPDPHHPEEHGWKDLMPVINTKINAHGNWSKKGPGLLGLPLKLREREPARLGLPVEPTGAYEMEVEIESKAVCTAALILCVRHRMVAAIIGGPGGKGGLHEVKHDPFTANETTSESTRLEAGREHVINARVEYQPGGEATIVVHLDGKMVIDWTGPTEDLDMPGEWHIGRNGIPGIGIGHKPVFFRRVQIRPLEGAQIHILGKPDRPRTRRFIPRRQPPE